MPWFNVDDGFHSHPKALATSLSARGLWVTVGSWCSRHLTDGVVPSHVVSSFGGTPEIVEELVAAGLWKKRRGGYVFHEWSPRNPTRAEVEAMRAKKAEAGQKGGLASARARRAGSIPVGKEIRPVDNSQKSANDGGPGSDQPQSRSKTQARASPPASPVVEPQSLSSYRAKNAGARGAVSAATPAKPKPPWCGMCDRDTRQTGPADAPYRCPACHPLIERY